MCTVSYIQNAGSIVLTSNRDEHVDRPLALPPQPFLHGTHTLYYPKDPKGNGTWFCVNDHQEALVLLNGAAQKHVPQPPYRQSRGLIVLELFQTRPVLEHWGQIDLTRIEPFTLVYCTAHRLVQLHWVGVKKTTVPLDEKKPHIWSSSTLYSDAIRAERETWFNLFLQQKNNHPNNLDMLQFHTGTRLEDAENGLIINRNAIMRTKSITQCTFSGSGVQFKHCDLIAETNHTICLGAN